MSIFLNKDYSHSQNHSHSNHLNQLNHSNHSNQSNNYGESINTEENGVMNTRSQHWNNSNNNYKMSNSQSQSYQSSSYNPSSSSSSQPPSERGVGVPERIFQLPEMQRLVKQTICEYANTHSMGEVEAKYYISRDVIGMWQKELSTDSILQGLIGGGGARSGGGGGSVSGGSATYLNGGGSRGNNTNTYNNNIYNQVKREDNTNSINNNYTNSTNPNPNPNINYNPLPKYSLDPHPPRAPPPNVPTNLREMLNTQLPMNRCLHTRPRQPPPPRPSRRVGGYTESKRQELNHVLGVEEIHRILYDFQTLGISTSTRKWGIYRRTYVQWVEAIGITPRNTRKALTIDEKTVTWEDKTLEAINAREDKFINLGVEGVTHSFKNMLLLKGGPDYTQADLVKLCRLGMEKGIAVVAAKYGGSLFQFEFLMMHLCPLEYDLMVKNNWFILQEGENNLDEYNWQRTDCGETNVNLTTEQQMEIIKCMKDEGVLFAHKKYHLSFSRIHSMNSIYKKFGMRALNLAPKHKTVIIYIIYIYRRRI